MLTTVLDSSFRSGLTSTDNTPTVAASFVRSSCVTQSRCTRMSARNCATVLGAASYSALFHSMPNLYMARLSSRASAYSLLCSNEFRTSTGGASAGLGSPSGVCSKSGAKARLCTNRGTDPTAATTPCVTDTSNAFIITSAFGVNVVRSCANATVVTNTPLDLGSSVDAAKRDINAFMLFWPMPTSASVSMKSASRTSVGSIALSSTHRLYARDRSCRSRFSCTMLFVLLTVAANDLFVSATTFILLTSSTTTRITFSRHACMRSPTDSIVGYAFSFLCFSCASLNSSTTYSDVGFSRAQRHHRRVKRGLHEEQRPLDLRADGRVQPVPHVLFPEREHLPREVVPKKRHLSQEREHRRVSDPRPERRKLAHHPRSHVHNPGRGHRVVLQVLVRGDEVLRDDSEVVRRERRVVVRRRRDAVKELDLRAHSVSHVVLDDLVARLDPRRRVDVLRAGSSRRVLPSLRRGRVRERARRRPRGSGLIRDGGDPASDGASR
eukprot:30850-Pelagococcus_subviridis.AAC.5